MDNKQCIIIVDDHPDLLTLLEAVLGEEGYTIYAVESGHACIEVLDEKPVDMVITDLNMPDMSGFELCEIIKDEYEHLDLPVLFLSGLDKEEQAVRAGHHGPDEFLTKPIDADDLIERVHTILQFQSAKH